MFVLLCLGYKMPLTSEELAQHWLAVHTVFPWQPAMYGAGLTLEGSSPQPDVSFASRLQASGL